jgi:ABC-type nickel/cobalt efflux system permease component RcnA
LIAVGVSGGLLPCPTALVVLLAAISLHRVAYGLVLIVAFSVGLAAVVTGIGLLAVGSRRLFNRVSLQGPIVRALPAASALIIIGLGLAMTFRALPTVA